MDATGSSRNETDFFVLRVRDDVDELGFEHNDELVVSDDCRTQTQLSILSMDMQSMASVASVASVAAPPVDIAVVAVDAVAIVALLWMAQALIADEVVLIVMRTKRRRQKNAFSPCCLRGGSMC